MSLKGQYWDQCSLISSSMTDSGIKLHFKVSVCLRWSSANISAGVHKHISTNPRSTDTSKEFGYKYILGKQKIVQVSTTITRDYWAASMEQNYPIHVNLSTERSKVFISDQNLASNQADFSSSLPITYIL